MRLVKIGLITLAATAAFAAPAQAQEEICFDNTGTQLDGNCMQLDRLDRICYGGRCVEGLWGNVQAIIELYQTLPGTIDGIVDDLLPDRLCTPPLPRQPICISG